MLKYTGGMSMSVSEVEQAMLALDRREIAALVHRGIQVLEEGDLNNTQEGVNAAWRDEVAQRINDIQSGKVETVPLDESCDRARAAIAAMRK